MANGWEEEVTQEQFTNAFNGARTQAIAFGLDVNTPEMQSFLVHQAEVVAAAHAGGQYYANALNKATMEGKFAL